MMLKIENDLFFLEMSHKTFVQNAFANLTNSTLIGNILAANTTTTLLLPLKCTTMHLIIILMPRFLCTQFGGSTS